MVAGPPSPRATTSDRVGALLAALAGALHVALLPEHFDESVLYGLVFGAIASFQLILGLALVRHPTMRVREVGRWGSLLIVVIFLGARLVVPPAASEPEPVTPIGVASLFLELAAVVALSVGLSLPRGARASFPWQPSLAAGGTFALVELLASGAIAYGTSPLGDVTKGWVIGWFGIQQLGGAPAIAVLIAEHWFVYLAAVPIALTVAVAALLAIAVGIRIRVSAIERCGVARFGLLGALPAVFAAPPCCAPSLLAALGVVAASVLGVLALPLLGLSAVLLAADVWWLRRLLRQTQPTTL